MGGGLSQHPVGMDTSTTAFSNSLRLTEYWYHAATANSRSASLWRYSPTVFLEPAPASAFKACLVRDSSNPQQLVRQNMPADLIFKIPQLNCLFIFSLFFFFSSGCSNKTGYLHAKSRSLTMSAAWFRPMHGGYR